MTDYSQNEQMLDMFLFETSQNIEQLENCILETEKSQVYSLNSINEIFRIMHTIKGSSAMMLFNNISSLAHTMEDLFYYIRENKPKIDNNEKLTDLLLDGVDFIKIELEKIKIHDSEVGNCEALNTNIKIYITELKQNNTSTQIIERQQENENIQYYILAETPVNEIVCYKSVVFFEDGCEMENIRAYTIIHNLRHETRDMCYYPSDILDNDNAIKIIREKGFMISFKSEKSQKEIREFFERIIFLKLYELNVIEENEFKQNHARSKAEAVDNSIKIPKTKKQMEVEIKEKESPTTSTNQNIISVNISKLDRLMDLVGEMVISESLVTQNPDLDGLELDNFLKAARQHHKIIADVQDLVMSIRMVPLSATFHKMYRLVRDMNKKLHKDADLILIGEETEVDKNIIEHISDPLMHLVRNAIDHGIETIEVREAMGKDRIGKVTIEAKNSGSDVIIRVMDDGNGLSKEKILVKAREAGLLMKAESDMTDREIYNLTLLPGFSTKEKVSEYSGRGVGMDVVTKNIETIGGTIFIDSVEGKGTVITLKIPLTLAIIDGMNIRVGESRYTIPITSIKESFRPNNLDIITDPDGNEMIMVRGNCYNILRLHRIFEVKTDIDDFTKGILIMVEQDGKTFCLFADELLGQQQVVVKMLPKYLNNIKKIHGISGCTLLGDGSISLIINIVGLIN